MICCLQLQEALSPKTMSGYRNHERNPCRWSHSDQRSRNRWSASHRQQPYNHDLSRGGRYTRDRLPEEKRNFTVIKNDDTNSSFTIITNNENPFVNAASETRSKEPSREDIYCQLSFKQTTYFEFAPKDTSDVLKMALLYSVARLIYENETDESLIPVIAAAEFTSDYYEDNKVLYGRLANEYFTAVMSKAIRDPRFILKVQTTPLLMDTLLEFGLPKVFPSPNPEPLTGSQYMRLLQILSTALDPMYLHCDLIVLLTALIACLQQNNVTEKFLRHVEDVVHQDLDKKIRLDIKSVKIFYTHFLCNLTSDESFDEIISKLRVSLPEAPLLKHLLKKKPGGGLLPLVVLGRALTECSDFPWKSTMALYPKDWKGVDAAIRAVDGDRYYAYRLKKSDAIHPKNYENLAWLAKTLCILKLNDKYEKFDDWIEVPQKLNEVKRLIAEYLPSNANK